MRDARRLRVTGTVQGVGFRPFVARLAAFHRLGGWVLNSGAGVEIHVEGRRPALDGFEEALRTQAPAVSQIAAVDSTATAPAGLEAFEIRQSQRGGRATARISPDLPLCDACLQELTAPSGRRLAYPYINCTNCGPRFSIVRTLPYDRARTTMASWEMCVACREEYEDPRDRRFHAEPIACPRCGPHYRLVEQGHTAAERQDAVERAARLLRDGRVLAVKGIGGYHLSCDARNGGAVAALRRRKYRKSKPFAVMARDLAAARTVADLDERAEALLTSSARPIVLAPMRTMLPGVAPDGYREVGLMLPYAPIHELLFAAGAPGLLVMTSANRSSEPIAFEDADALQRLDGIADAFLVGERPIARRVDDSVVRSDSAGPIVLRRSRGFAPGSVARLPVTRPVLAVGADLKNTITLVVGGEAFVSQHIGDLEHVSAYEAFKASVCDLIQMYDIDSDDLLVAHDLHPHYASTAYAAAYPAGQRIAVQHHRAHVASVLAEREALDTRVLGVAFDGAGYGDDGTTWGGEFFVGSVSHGFSRAASLRPFALPGGDGAARVPVQAAAGILHDVDGMPECGAPPFSFPPRYLQARQLVRSGIRTFTCTSAGRLFDAAAALLGFTQQIEYEGQAAVWIEQLAWRGRARHPLPVVCSETELDLRPTLRALAERRLAGHDVCGLARAFHDALADGIVALAKELCQRHGVETVVLSGGTFQNALLLDRVRDGLAPLPAWINHAVPSNDGGISLGQAAVAAIAAKP